MDRALAHYQNRLKEIQTDEDVIKFGSDLMTKDIQKNIDDVAFTRKHLSGVIRESVINPEDRKSLCDSLTCYISDLRDIIQKTREKLYSIDIQFMEIDQEIKNSEEMKNRICHG